MNATHLSDERLIELCLADVTDRSEEPHLNDCPSCDARFSTLAAMLDETSLALAADADRAFPPERLARQHARILQQIEQEGRPARVIAFPAAQTPPLRLTRRPLPRWIAAAGAVAAAFVVGVLADHLTHDTTVAPPRLATRSIDPGAPVRTVAAVTVSDDELLGQIEAAVGSTGPAALRPLDAVTPRAWDVRSEAEPR
jgi:anti-sigma factor RsiW